MIRPSCAAKWLWSACPLTVSSTDLFCALRGETLICPLAEGVLVVEKYLLLREEPRITTSRVETRRRQRVTLRREQTVGEHITREGDESNPYP